MKRMLLQKFSTTVDKSEISRFSALSTKWWKEGGEFQALHTMNHLRVPLIRDGLSPTNCDHDCLAGKAILDVGCGGGILSEALANLGASVIGLDVEKNSIDVAEYHASLNEKITENLQYFTTPLEEFKCETQFDAIVLSEVVEHVINLPTFIECAAALTKPGGSIFITTINKTTASYLLAILGAEYILRIVPRGTHSWNKFVPPSDLQSLLTQYNFRTHLLHGMSLNPVNLRWHWTSNLSVNYALHAIKDHDS